MASTYTTNKRIEKPASGDYTNAWAPPVNADWDVIDQCFGGVTFLNATAGDATLADTQYRSLILSISGAISADVTYTIPSGKGGQWIVYNNTTDSVGGPWNITIASGGGGTTYAATRGQKTLVYSDGTNINVVNAAPTITTFPSGGIILWSGSIASVPAGWYLCDGTNGTPNLRDRFVVGAGSTYAVAATGGSANATLVAHSHTATSSVSDPGHAHGNGTIYPYNGTGDRAEQNQSGGPESYTSFNVNTTTSTTGISVSTSVSTEGSSATNANLPPYYALAYIMKA